MSNALVWIRKSKGTDDDIGLQQQREKVKKLADGLADTVEMLDLGVHTGFSSMSRDSDADQLLDENDEVSKQLELIESGVYDYIVAWDDRRICRDEFFSVIEYKASSGDAEFVYVGEVEDDDLTFDIKRRIERDTKEEEIRKSISALKERQERGYYHGRPYFGFKYDENGQYLVPDPDEFDEAIRAIDMADEGSSYSDIIQETEIGSEATLSEILNDRKDMYMEHKDSV